MVVKMDSVIELRNITKEYNNQKVVDDLTMSIYKGEILGFLGPNGAGKTTSINIMTGLLNPTSGSVNIKNYSKTDIGMCPQDIILWDYLTCYENLYIMGQMYDIPKNTLKKRIDEILKKLILYDKKDTVIEKLSGGMKRRMNIAMATIHNPKLLVLDEPSEGLDPQSRRILWDYINSEKEKGNTIILTTHLMDEADTLSDRVAILNNGKLLKLDTPDNLKSSIGTGDILEIKLKNNIENTISELKKLTYIKNIARSDDKLSINLLNATNKLPEILKIIDNNKSLLKNITIRQNTLEDVFIELTGRQLRE